MSKEVVFYLLGEDGVLLPNVKKAKKGPGRMYVDKDTFDYYYLTLGYNRIQMASIGIGSKVFERSYHYHYPDRADRVKIGGGKIAISQARSNSNRINTGKLKKTLPENALRKDVEGGKTYSYMKLKYKVSEPTLVKNLQAYSLTDTYITMGVMRSDKVDRYRILERLLNRPLIPKLTGINKDISYITTFIHEAEAEIVKCKEVAQWLRRIYNLGPTRSPNSCLERFTIEYLDDNDIEWIPQYKVDNFFYDFMLPNHGVLLEIDGFGHKDETDRKKDIIAKNNGYDIIRIDFKNKKYTHKTRKICLQKIELNLYERLGLKPCMT